MELNKRKEELSIAYVNAVASIVGCTMAHWSQDEDSVDVSLRANLDNPDVFFSEVGVDIQLKCTSIDVVPTDNFSFPLKLKNYDDLRRSSLYPKILVVLLVPNEISDWVTFTRNSTTICYSAYWLNLKNPFLPDTTNTTSVNVQINTDNLFNDEALRYILNQASQGLQP